MTDAEKVKVLTEACEQALRALEGRYPWPIAAKFTQKEARETAAATVRDALATVRK